MKSEEVMRILENAIRIGKGVIRYGSVASYIPELAKADKNKLGICLYTIDGNQFETGNTEDRFTIQSSFQSNGTVSGTGNIWSRVCVLIMLVWSRQGRRLTHW